MPLRYTLEVLGDVQIEREFLRWSERARDASELWDVLHGALMDMEHEQFVSQGGHGSEGWSPLKAVTVAEKQRRGYPTEILWRTLTLMDSLTKPDAAGSLFENFGEYMRFGTTVDYAIYHQTGTSRMPARKPVQLTKAERQALTRSVQRFIVTGEAADPRLTEVY